MNKHFIHYLPRRITTHIPQNGNNPWFAIGQNPAAGFSRPQFHTSRRKTGPTQEVRPGDTIWLASQIFSPWGALPPGIDARFDVERIEKHSDGILRFVAAATSTWLPLADATIVLATLESTNATGHVGRIWSDPNGSIGHSLQSMRCLASAEPLRAWTAHLNPMHAANFISYRICDGTRAAYIKVKELLKNGEVVFWDRWSLPRRLAERREVVDDSALNSYLMENLHQSKVVWGIESPKYSAINSYSVKEQSEAIRLGTYRAA